MKKLVAILLTGILVAGANFAGMASNDDDNNSKETHATMTTNVVGQVVDQSTGEALTGVKVEILGTDEEAYTDFEGNFKMKNLKPGKYDINLSFISYKTNYARMLRSKSGKIMN